MENKKSGQDEYLSMNEYQGKPKSETAKAFSAFAHEGESYFAFLDAEGNVLMRSEGYSSTKGRDNGIKSVSKNKGNKSRWSVKEVSGKYFIILKAGNNQEIARSEVFKSEAQAQGALDKYLQGNTSWATGAGNVTASNEVTEEDKEDDYLPTSEYKNHPITDKKNNVALFKHEDGQFYFAVYNKEGKVKLRSEGFESAQNRKVELDGVLKYHNNDDLYMVLERGKFFMMVLKDKNGREIGRSPLLKKTDSNAAMLSKASKKTTKSTSASNSGIAAAAAAGTVGASKIISRTRGEGKIVSSKVIGENVVSKNTISESRNQIGEKRNQLSEKRNSLGEKRNVLSTKRNVLKETKSKVKEDDYLECAKYKGHKIVDEKNRVATFKGDDNQFYFAIYDKKGNVRLRSEGFKSDKGREDELKQVILCLEDEARYTTIKKGNYFINILKDKTGREVARSCGTKEMGMLVAPIAVAAAAAVVAPIVVKKKVEKKVEKKVVKKVEKKVVKKVEPVKQIVKKKTPPPPPPKKVPVAAAAPVKEAAGCFKWWMLLLLLIPLLLLLLKFGCATTPPPVVVPPIVTPVVPPPPPPPVVVPKTCDCNALTHPVFKIPSGPAPKTIDVLGRAPEYGSLVSLNPETFYNKLKAKYDGSAMERRFLDGIFKQMGYENGFKDASPELFSSVNVPSGTTGNMGTRSSHRTLHRTLTPTNRKDLSAFRIKAENACDLHFMKTCGNHFFYGPCD